MPVAEAMQQAGQNLAMTWEQMQTFLASQNVAFNAMTGSGIVSAAAKFGYTFYGSDTGVSIFLKTATDSTAADMIATGSASNLFESFVSAAGGVIRHGAAAVTTAFGNVALAVKDGVATAVGVLSVPLPTAVAAMAPVLGVSCGVALYKSNPELWTKISKALLPWCWKDTQYVKSYVDDTGQTYFPQGALDKLGEIIADYKLNRPSTGTAHSGPFVFSKGTLGEKSPLGNMYRWENRVLGTKLESGTQFVSGKYFWKIDCRESLSSTPQYEGYLLSISDQDSARWTLLHFQQELSYFFQKDTFICYPMLHSIDIDAYLINSGGVVTFGIEIKEPTDGGELWPGNNGQEIGWWILDPEWADISTLSDYDGEYTEPDSGDDDILPEWTGNPTDPTLPKIGIITSPNPNEDDEPETEPYYPISIPDTEPGISIKPTIQPDPNRNPDPDRVITPYIPPNPDPSVWPDEYPRTWPDPTVTPTPDPNPDPSTNPDPDPNPDPSPTPEPEIPPIDNPSPLPDPDPPPDPDPDPKPDVDPSTDPDDDTDPETPGEPDTPTPPDAPPDEGETPEPEPPEIPPYFKSGATGLLHVYNPTAAEVTNFGAWLWSTWSGDLSDLLQKVFGNHPLDGVIGLHEFYASPILATDEMGDPMRDKIKCGFLDSGIESNIVGERYSVINCGSVIVPEYWGNYLDYAPYTKTNLYLPFVGIVNLDADDVIGHSVNVTYHCDAFTGCVIAMVTCAKQGYNVLTYQFQGNCAVQIPLTSGSQISYITSGLSVAASAIGAGMTGGIGGAVASLATSGIHAAGNTKATVSHSGSFGSSFGAMGLKKPYLIIKRPVQKVVSNYRVDYGLPAHKRVKLSDCSGYVRAVEVNVKSATATENEKRMIADLLKSGVYV